MTCKSINDKSFSFVPVHSMFVLACEKCDLLLVINFLENLVSSCLLLLIVTSDVGLGIRPCEVNC